mmetsp:Transcript_8428/g.26248  ORF Transcript_8428/g.26248 Transcript_8428/m.26248 type:complete len:436 (+) Transcript_8428:29-1336(+)
MESSRAARVVATGAVAVGVTWAIGWWARRERRRRSSSSSEVVPLDIRLGLTSPLSEERPVRWLFLGAGRVAHDYANALKTVPGAVLYAVATRSASGLARGEAFRALHGFSRTYSSYAEAVADPAVDVVYLSAMHSERVAHTTLILEAGKHAVVEKPFACGEADARRLFELARAKGVFLCEGMWTRYFPAVEKARELIDSGAIGAVTAVASDFGFDAADSGAYPSDFSDPRDGDPIYHASIGGGALLWAGPYPIAAGFLPFGGETEPASVVAAGVADRGRTGVELSAGLALTYARPGGVAPPTTATSGCPARGATVSLFVAIDSETTETTTYVGQLGRIVVRSPGHCPTSLLLQLKRPGRGTTEDRTFLYPLPDGPFANTADNTPFNYPNSAGFAYEAAAVMRCILAGRTECPQYTTADCLRTMRLIQTARDAILS